VEEENMTYEVTKEHLITAYYAYYKSPPRADVIITNWIRRGGDSLGYLSL